MKKQSFTAALLIVTLWNTITVSAQEVVGHFYQLKVDHQLQETDINGNTGSFIIKTLPGGSRFTVVNKLSNGDYVIKFWNWGKDETLNAVRTSRQATAAPNAMTFNSAVTTPPDARERKIESFNVYYDVGSSSWKQRYFKISSGDLTLFSKEVESKWSPAAGVATLPFKARPKTGEFTKDLSITGLGGFRYNGLYGNWSTLLGIGIASVTLDSVNTGGTLKKSSDFAAVSISVGEVFEWKKLQIGLFLGFDKVKKADENGWKNQGKFWWGIGIGFSIFSENAPAKEGTNKNK